MDDCHMLECFLHHPDPNEIPFPLNYTLLRQQQFEDYELQNMRNMQPDKFPIHELGDVQLVCYVPNPGDTWKIVIPT
jgi:hypothetical protein